MVEYNVVPVTGCAEVVEIFNVLTSFHFNRMESEARYFGGIYIVAEDGFG